MCFLPQDRRHLSHALALAAEAAAFASPNPAVGCVLTRGAETFAAGAHRYDARDHAEIVALKQAAADGQSASGATAFVTLEPCSHHGRTGPCSDALIAAGIARCVVATVDPNPQVSGSGIRRMRAAGIDVFVLPTDDTLTQQARRLNDAFAFSIRYGRPFVTLKAALSIDGKLAPPPATRTQAAPVWLSGETARADVQHLRHTSDALLTGIGTVLADDPALTDRTGRPRRRPLLRVILDTHLRTPPDAKLFSGERHSSDILIVCSQDASAHREDSLLRAGAEIVRLPLKGGRLPMAECLALLESRSIRSVLVEAGSMINAALLQQDLVDKAVLYFADVELGSDAVPFAAGAASPYTLAQQLQHKQRTTFANGAGEDVRITGYLHDPWSTVAW